MHFVSWVDRDSVEIGTLDVRLGVSSPDGWLGRHVKWLLRSDRKKQEIASFRGGTRQAATRLVAEAWTAENGTSQFTAEAVRTVSGWEIEVRSTPHRRALMAWATRSLGCLGPQHAPGPRPTTPPAVMDAEFRLAERLTLYANMLVPTLDLAREFRQWAHHRDGELRANQQRDLDILQARLILRNAEKKATKRRARPRFVYLMAKRDMYKIGKSYTPRKRAKALSSQAGVPVTLLAQFEMDQDEWPDAERQLHERFKEHRRLGEWFDAVPAIVSAFRERGADFMAQP